MAPLDKDLYGQAEAPYYSPQRGGGGNPGGWFWVKDVAVGQVYTVELQPDGFPLSRVEVVTAHPRRPLHKLQAAVVELLPTLAADASHAPPKYIELGRIGADGCMCAEVQAFHLPLGSQPELAAGRGPALYSAVRIRVLESQTQPVLIRGVRLWGDGPTAT
jgi:hypothetical protein